MERLADAPASPGIADELASDRSDLSALAGARATAAAPASTATSRPSSTRIAEAYTREGWSGVDALLDADPALVRDLVGSDRGTMEGSVEAALLSSERTRIPFLSSARAAWNADAIMDHVEERFVPMAREAVRREAVAGVDRMLAAIDGASDEELAALVSSSERGTPGFALRAMMVEDGGSVGPSRVAEMREHARHELVELRGTLMGGTWSPDELPGSTGRVMRSMGLERAVDGSVAAAAFHRDELEAASAAGLAEMGGDLLVAVAGSLEELHGGLLVGAATAAPELALAAGSLVVGVAIHHGIAENRAERRATAHMFGL